MMKILIKDPLIINDYDDNDDDKDIPSSSMIMTIMIMTNMTKMIIIMLMVMMFKVQNDDDPRLFSSGSFEDPNKIPIVVTVKAKGSFLS